MDSNTSHRRPPPPYPQKLTVALFGKEAQFKTIIGNMILDSQNTSLTSDTLVMGESNSFKIINVPDLCDEGRPHPDQDIIDFMAVSYPGPNLFILAIEPENAIEEQVIAQIIKLQHTFGENVTEHLILVFQDKESLHSLSHLGEDHCFCLSDGNLANYCRKVCSGLLSFAYDYKNYSKDVVTRRRTILEERRCNGQPLHDHEEPGADLMSPSTSQQAYAATPEATLGYHTDADPCAEACAVTPGATLGYHAGADLMSPSASQQAFAVAPGATLGHHTGADLMSPSAPQQAFAAAPGATLGHHTVCNSYGEQDRMFNIVLLGLTGTGKSASANTILMAGNSRLLPNQLFKSQPSSMPITTEVQFKITVKQFGMEVRVVDTPDFFNDEVQNSEAQVEKCKKYCQPQQCVVLLVIQLGRFTHGERGILEKLEDKFGWRMRDSTIVLLTHGDELKESPEYFINAHDDLRHIIECCSRRFQVFNNFSKDTKQVMELIKKIPYYKNIFPKLPQKNIILSDCCVC